MQPVRTPSLLDHLHPRCCRQPAGGLDLHHRAQPSENHDRRVPAEPSRGRPPLPVHAALLGRRCHQGMGLWSGPVQNGASRLQDQLLQQHAAAHLHQRGPLHLYRAGDQGSEHEEAEAVLQ